MVRSIHKQVAPYLQKNPSSKMRRGLIISSALTAILAFGGLLCLLQSYKVINMRFYLSRRSSIGILAGGSTATMICWAGTAYLTRISSNTTKRTQHSSSPRHTSEDSLREKVDQKECNTSSPNDKGQKVMKAEEYTDRPITYETLRKLRGTFKVRENTYRVIHASNDAGPWIRFDSGVYPDNYDKFHLSIDRQQMAEAFAVIFPILIREGPTSFKILAPHLHDIEGNALGKEMVLYLVDHSKSFWEKLLTEIVSELEKNNIRPGPSSTSTIPVLGGKNFIHTRSSFNMLNCYISASLLKDSGFTRVEAAMISPSNWIPFRISTHQLFDQVEDPKIREHVESELAKAGSRDCEQSLFASMRSPYISSCPWLLIQQESAETFFNCIPYLQVSPPVEQQEFENVNLDLKKRIFQSFKQDLRGEYEGDVGVYINTHFESPVALLKLIGVSDSRHTGVYLFADEFAKITLPILYEYLDQAAQSAANIHDELSLCERETFGNILPAMYYCLLCPLAKRFAEGEYWVLEEVEFEWRNLLSESKFLLSALVKCSLRIRGDQGISLHPRYVAEYQQLFLPPDRSESASIPPLKS